MASECFKTFRKRLSEWKRFLIIFLTPIILSPLPLIVQGKEARTGYAILIMGTYWCTEVTNLAVTALLPLFLFPILSVMPASEISTPYFKDTNVLVLGGLVMAVAIEKWNVHKRIALKVLLLIGAQPRRLMLGFMLVTAFISMWITNTATTAMMTPIMEAVLKQLDKDNLPEPEPENSEGNETDVLASTNDKTLRTTGSSDDKEDISRIESEAEMVELSAPMHPKVTSQKGLIREQSVSTEIEVKNRPAGEEDPRVKKYNMLCKAMMLSICYSANIGGTGTLTGTAPQLVLAGQLTDVFKDGPGMSFLAWFLYAFPEMLFFLIIAWIYLQMMFFGIGWKHLCCCFRWKKRNTKKGQGVYKLMKKQYDELGPISFAEYVVFIHFIALVLFWLFRDPKFIPGWGSLFPMGKKSYVSDSTSAMLVIFSMFLFPSKRPVILGGKQTGKPHKTILEWKETQLKFPWNITILLGSGFALAKACESSGLSMWLGCQLTALDSVPNFIIALVISILLTFLTEFTSNTATATILLPVLASLSQSIKVHPYYLMVPATVCASFAFMLPVATPPNAIVFATGRLTIPDMMKAGFGMNIIGILVVTISINTLGIAYFGLNTFPAWAAISSAANKCGGAAATNASVATTVATTAAAMTTAQGVTTGILQSIATTVATNATNITMV